MSLVLSTGAQLNVNFFSSSNFSMCAAEADRPSWQVRALAVPLALLPGFNIWNGSFQLSEIMQHFSVSCKRGSGTGCSSVLQNLCHQDYGLISSPLTTSEHWQGKRKVPMGICSSQQWMLSWKSVFQAWSFGTDFPFPHCFLWKMWTFFFGSGSVREQQLRNNLWYKYIEINSYMIFKK